MSLTRQTERFVQKRDAPMTSPQPDRRSQRTQQALIEALIALLAVKHYDEISVNDLVARANVGRATFYAHYQNKADLLKSGFERVLDGLIQQVDLGETGEMLHWDATPLFRHAQGHYELYRTLAWGSGFDVLTKDGHAALSAKFLESLRLRLAGRPEPSVPLAVLAYAIAGTLLLLLKWWLDNKMPYTPEAMNDMFQQLVMSNLQAILGRPGADAGLAGSAHAPFSQPVAAP
jgi:AcrR family transcriptional regulator